MHLHLHGTRRLLRMTHFKINMRTLVAAQLVIAPATAAVGNHISVATVATTSCV